MAIQSSYEKSLRLSSGQSPAPSFSATGDGLNVKTNARVANSTNANACLEIPGVETLRTRPNLQKIYLFVTRVATSWTISGTYGQTEKSRSWYPRNLAQNEFIVEGQMVDQYQYDLLVEFVQYHHNTLVDWVDETLTSKVGNFTRSALLTLWPTTKNSVEDAIPTNIFGPNAASLQIGVIITSIKAGHERFQFAPAFTLTCKVVEDKLHENQEVAIEILDALNVEEVFGSYENPEPSSNDFPGNIPSGALRDAHDRQVAISDGSTATMRRGSSTLGDQRGRTATAATGGGDDSPGTTAQTYGYASQIAAAAPGLFAPEWGNQRKKMYLDGGREVIPPDMGKAWFAYGGVSDQGKIQGKKDGKDYIKVKYRDPRAQGDKGGSQGIDVFV